MNTKINFLDLHLQLNSIKQEVFELFEEVYDEAAFSGGTFVERFESDFAEFCGTNYAIGLNNGTSALHLGLLSVGIGHGDEVIIPANTFIATAWGVSYCGAKPVFVDCDPETWEIDVNDVSRKISSKTKAVVGVHLYGQPFDFDLLSQHCKDNNLFLIEDAAQAHGAEYKNRVVGTLGDLACFSFYPGKNLGACGEAGGIATNNVDYYNKLKSLRNHGSVERYFHDELGYNMRMGGLEAASLIVRLKRLKIWNNRRREIAEMYFNEIVNPKVIFQKQPVWAKSVFHLFVVTVDNREQFISFLNSKGIFPGLHYPVPCHLQKAYHDLGYKKGDMPNAEYLAEHCVSLPMYPELTDDQISYVIEIINAF